MKLLTVNFLTCAVKTCKTTTLSFPLHFQDAELEQREVEYNSAFLKNILPRLDWDAITTTAAEVCIHIVRKSIYTSGRELIHHLLFLSLDLQIFPRQNRIVKTSNE